MINRSSTEYSEEDMFIMYRKLIAKTKYFLTVHYIVIIISTFPYFINVDIYKCI